MSTQQEELILKVMAAAHGAGGKTFASGGQDSLSPTDLHKMHQSPLDPFAPYPPRVATKVGEMLDPSRGDSWRKVERWDELPRTNTLSDAYFHYER